VQNTSEVGDKFYLLVQDDFTGYLWSYFIKAKSDLPDTMLDWLKLVQKKIKNISGETNLFIKLLLSQNLISSLI
jgi:hypothetical protein